MKAESQVSIAKIKRNDNSYTVASTLYCFDKCHDVTEKQEARGKLTRMNTTVKFDNARDAIRRYESKDYHSSSDNEDEGTAIVM